LDLLDPERERIDRTRQAIVGWCLIVATALALAAVALDTFRIIRGQARWDTDWPAAALLVALAPWLFWIGWRLANGYLDTGALLPPWGLIFAGLSMEGLAVVIHQWVPQDPRPLGWLVLPGVGAVVLGLQRWWRARSLGRSQRDVA